MSYRHTDGSADTGVNFVEAQGATLRIFPLARTARFALPLRVSRTLALLLVLGLTPVLQAQQATALPDSSTIFSVHESSAFARYEENRPVIRSMVQRLMTAATGKTEARAAWSALFRPTDRVAIKVAANGTRINSTRRAVVEAVLDGLALAGVSRQQTIVFDRSTATLRASGFDAEALDCTVRGIDPPGGWDRAQKFSAPVLGQLIWGDLLFVEKTRRRPGQPRPDDLSPFSHLPRILTSECDKLILLPTLAEDDGLGVAGAFYHATARIVDNQRRFTAQDAHAADSIPELYADPRISGKIALIIYDGLLAQYASSAKRPLDHSHLHGTLFTSRDPVALDATALRQIDTWRAQAELPPLAPRAQWLDAAQAAGLGWSNLPRIQQITVP